MVVRVHLSDLMGVHKMNQKQVVARSGVDKDTIRRLYYETAQSIRLDTIERLCKVFALKTTDDLIKYKDGGDETLDRAQRNIEERRVRRSGKLVDLAQESTRKTAQAPKRRSRNPAQ